jgi:mannose-6-phosphate isomerase-like protein (cupin superfamily)
MQARLLSILVVAAFALIPAIGSAQAAQVAGSLCAVGPASGATCVPIMDAAVALIPPPPAIMAMARITIQPQAIFSGIAVPGPTLLFIEQGALTVDMFGETGEEDELAAVESFVQLASTNGTPAPSTGAVVIAASGTFRVSLKQGDRLLIPGDWPHAMHNDGTEPTVGLVVALTPPEPAQGGPIWPPAGASPAQLPSGVSLTSLDTGYRATTAVPRTASTDFIVERVALAPGGSVSEDLTNPRLIYVESGGASVTAEGTVTVRIGNNPSGTKTGEMTLAAGDAVMFPDGVKGTIRNDGSDPLSILAFGIAPSSRNPGNQHEH